VDLPEPAVKTAANTKGITWRALLLAAALIPANCYWIVRSETGGAIFYSTTSSVFANAVFTLFLLVLWNEAARNGLRVARLTQAELLVVYGLVSTASALSGESVGQQLIRVISAPFWLATPENEWARLFHHWLPSWLVVQDRSALQMFYGGSSASVGLHLSPWLRALFPWFLLVLPLLLVMTCLNVLVRRRWADEEHLAYPLVQLPLLATDANRPLFANRGFWLGFLLAGGITLLNGFHFLFPAVPGVRPIQDLSPLFLSKPWDAMRPMVIALYPCGVGLAYFMPLDLAFSTWFFFLFWKGQAVLGASLGLRSLPGFPYASWQQAGAYLAVGWLALWTARHHLADAWREAVRTPRRRSVEPMSYRLAYLGLLAGLLGILAFAASMGFDLWLATPFFLLYLLFSVAVARMRAEAGPLVHELYSSNADEVITAVVGTRRMSPRSLAAMTTLWWLTRSQNSHVMPHQLEAFKMAERARFCSARLWPAMLAAAVAGLALSSLVVLDLGARFGGNAGFALETYNRLQRWLNDPTDTNIPATLFLGVGFVFSFFLLWMRRRFLWWPFHPIGYTVTQGDWAITYIWFSIFVSWALKWAILRYGGVRAYRRMIPIFLGLILGDFVVGAGWGLIGLAAGVRIYQFKNW